MKILIVDDDPGIQNALRANLSAAGHRTGVAGNGLHALQSIESSLTESEPYDLLLTDLRLPGLSGVELIRDCRQLQPDLPVILMTAYGSEELRKKVSGLGKCEYLEKPFTLENLQRAIEELRGLLNSVGQEPLDTRA
jgi:DNA-binding response OmpR family regulator